MKDFVELKAKIVEKDPAEQGERASLNLGHSFAHAHKSISQERMETPILHGQAVALGLIFASLLSKRLNYLNTQQCLKIIDVIKKNQLDLSHQATCRLSKGARLKQSKQLKK